jgi:hypothetical protein
MWTVEFPQRAATGGIYVANRKDVGDEAVGREEDSV